MSKVALITGGSRGIGAAAAVELSAMGYSVAVCYKSNDKAAEDVKRKIILSWRNRRVLQGGYFKSQRYRRNVYIC